MFDFEKFPVYQTSEKLYSELWSILQDSKVPIYLVSQLDRAASSITLNIAEGAGKYSKRDKKKFYTIARGSTQECVAILRLLRTRELVSLSQYNNYYSQLEIISKMLSGLINKMKQ